jgi:hypothetical protein
MRPAPNATAPTRDEEQPVSDQTEVNVSPPDTSPSTDFPEHQPHTSTALLTHTWMPGVHEGFGETATTPLTTVSWSQLESALPHSTEKATEDWYFLDVPPGFLAASVQDQGVGAEDKSTATDSMRRG